MILTLSSSISQQSHSPLQLTQVLILFLLTISCVSEFTNPGCDQFDDEQKCIGCKDRYFLEWGVCYPVSPLCLDYDSKSGACLSCYENY